MRTVARSCAAAALLALGAVAIGAACEGSKGQLMLVFQTDMSLPKDIDAIRILVTLEGSVVYDQTFERLGDEGSIRLPSTLGFLTPDDATQAVSVRVTASRGGDEGVRFLREVVTTVPEGRTATLHLPIQFLCDGSGEPERDETGKVKRDASGAVVVKNACGEGKTCVAGACVDAAVDSTDLPDYVPDEVFGGGTGNGDGACFDTVKCLAQAAPAELDLEAFAADPTACTVAAEGEINVALLTQGGGICGQTACYIPLDGESDAGFRSDGSGRVRLPPAVCAKVAAGDLLGVVTAKAGSGACRQKRLDLPTCGPWSATGADQYAPPDGSQPTPIALGQTHPISLVVAPSGVYWIAGSTFDSSAVPNSDGAIKTVPLGGGEPLVIAEAQPSPRGLAVDDASQLVFWTNAGTGDAATQDGAILAAVPGVGDPIPLFEGLPQPEGVARLGDKLYWTQLWGDDVLEGDTLGAGLDIAKVGDPVSLTPGGPLATSPYRITAAQDIVCWTYQGTLQGNDGVVACKRAEEAAQAIATQLRTPRAIALDASGGAAVVYWASFEGGSVSRAELGAPGVEEIASGQAFPSSIAVDAESVYWTNRGDGTVMRAPKAGGPPILLASGQLRPGAIAVDDTAVYWINEGSPDLADGSPAKDGAILKLAR